MAETSFMEKKHSSRYKEQKLELEGKVAKSSSKARVLEKLEGPLLFGKNKVSLPPPAATCWEIKDDNDVSQHADDLKRESYR